MVFTDADGDTLTYSGTADSAKGHLTVNPDGTFTYTPTAAARHAAATGSETDLQDGFTITVNDAHGGTPTTILTLTITTQNNAPVVGGSAITGLDLDSDDQGKIVVSSDGRNAYTIVDHYDADTTSYSYSLATIDTADQCRHEHSSARFHRRQQSYGQSGQRASIRGRRGERRLHQLLVDSNRHCYPCRHQHSGSR